MCNTIYSKMQFINTNNAQNVPLINQELEIQLVVVEREKDDFVILLRNSLFSLGQFILVCLW